MPAKISVVIITYNEESVIKNCLESVKWADEILVIDSNSKDKTVSICKTFTDRVYTRQWQGYGHQKNYANQLASHEWILSIDADEVVTSALRDEIRHAIENPENNDVVAFQFPRKTYFLDRWMLHGGMYPNVLTRLFRKGHAHWTHDEVHEKLIPRGKVKLLQNDLLHYSFKDISDQVRTNNIFSSLSALSLIRNHKPFRYSSLILNPTMIFVKMFILKRGFLDGLAGFVIAASSAYAEFLKYAKYWELRNNSSRHKPKIR